MEFNPGSIVGLAVGLIVAAAILPTAVVSITNTTAWEGAPTAVITLVPVLGIIAVVAIVLMMLRRR